MIKEIVFLPRKPGVRGNPPRKLVIECDNCHNLFERPNSTEFTKKTRHFCSNECWYLTSRGPKGSHGGETITKKCGHCGKDVVRLASQSHGKLDFFCGRSCVSEYKKMHQDPRAIEALKRTTDDPEFRAFMSTHAKERFARDGHPWQDRKHTDETKEKLRLSHAISGRSKGQNNGMYERGHTEISRAKMSETHSRNIIEGKAYIYGGSKHKSGWHTSSKGNDEQPMFYHSSWEEALMFHFDEDKNVIRYVFERLRIAYYYQGKKRHYVPDFLVTYCDGRRSLIEIKPKQFLDNEKTKLKAEAAQIYCETNGIEKYEILTGEILRERGIIT